jgi:hypothetical protein
MHTRDEISHPELNPSVMHHRRRPYTTPKLTAFGTVAQYTQGQSGASCEYDGYSPNGSAPKSRCQS